MNSPIVRPAKLSDLTHIVSLSHLLLQREQALFDESLLIGWSDLRTAKHYYRSRIKEQGGAAFVLELDGQLIGYLMAGILGQETFRKPLRMAEIEEMFVHDAHRGKGLGKLLFQSFKAWCTSREITRIRVEAYAKNSAAILFYEQVGFEGYALVMEQDIR